MNLHRFNADGIAAFSDYRTGLTLDPALPPPSEFLADPALTEEIAGEIEILPRKFANRLDAGQYLNELIDSAGSAIKRPERDKGLWAWLTLFYNDEVCPRDGNGHRKPLGEERLMPLVDNFQRFYRHLLLGPYLIVRAHKSDPERAIAMLCSPLWKPGEIVAQLAASAELVTNPGVVEMATKLYYDPGIKSFKRGAGSSTKGAARRLAALLNQLDLNFYLYGMTSEELIALLPKEFDRFRAKP
jgi:hypothetical protein